MSVSIERARTRPESDCQYTVYVSREQVLQSFEDLLDENQIRIGLLSRTGEVPARSGLNWGQRPGRNGNEAYLAVPLHHAKSGFFPEIGTPFQVVTDTGYTLQLVRCQQLGKALQSLPRNSILGLYFRERLGVASGMPITTSHLLAYGRTDIELTRLSELNYVLNFGFR